MSLEKEVAYQEREIESEMKRLQSLVSDVESSIDKLVERLHSVMRSTSPVVMSESEKASIRRDPQTPLGNDLSVCSSRLKALKIRLETILSDLEL